MLAQPVTISRVVDGDTVHGRPVDGSPTIKIRVLGIDAPETRDADGRVECWAAESTAFAAATLLGQPVTVLGDPTQAARDRYDRVLGYVILPDGRNFSVLAAAAGAARSYVYDRPVREQPAIRWAEGEARMAGRGMWGRCPG